MPDGSTRIGTVRVRGKDRDEVYPLEQAEIGITRFADVSELWLAASAGPPAGETDADEELPSAYASVLLKAIIAEELPGRKFSIPGYRPGFDEPRAMFGYHAHGDDFAESLISVASDRDGDGSYRVTWTGRTDYYSGATPDAELAFEIEGSFRFRGVKEVPRPLKYVRTNPLYRLATVRLPVCGAAGLLTGVWVDRLGPCTGLAAGAVLGLLWTYASWSLWERDMRRLMASGNRAS
ncbi:MAG TPA: hypothetical protein VF170_10830 [Planctomycetaceae bacterium]